MILADLSPSGTAELAPAVIETHNLTRYFGSKCAVDTVSLSVPRGSVFAFIGRSVSSPAWKV